MLQFTIQSEVALSTFALVALRSIDASSAVETRRTVALVDVHFALLSSKARRAHANELVMAVHLESSVLALDRINVGIHAGLSKPRSWLKGSLFQRTFGTVGFALLFLIEIHRATRARF